MQQDYRLTAARDRVARLKLDLAEARAELQVLEDVASKALQVVGIHTRADDEAVAVAAAVTAESSSAEKVALFRRRFAGRADVYAQRWVSRRTGKSGWSPAVRGGFYTDQVSDADLLPLDDAVTERHLRGDAGDREFHVGLYPMLPDDRCRLLVCDFDDGEWRQDASAYAQACRGAGVGALAEISRSGEGAHVWIFFETAVPAVAARVMGTALLRSAMSLRSSMALSSYDRFFPAQDTLPQRSPGRLRLGNLIALPLQGECRRRGTSVFADPERWEPYADQFAALAAVASISEAQLNDFTTRAPALRSGPETTAAPLPRRSSSRLSRVRVAGTPIDIRRDAVVRIPLEGVPGALITELKHAASVANPEFYRKQAQRFSTFGTPRLVTCFEHDESELRLPRGLLDQVTMLLTDAGYHVTTSIESGKPADIDLNFVGELREAQQIAVDSILSHDDGVLVAPPGAGKTVIACALIAARATPTAILVNRAELLEQWRDRLTQFLTLHDNQIGQLGNGRRKRRGVVDLIMMQSISHRDADPSVLEEYGQIIVDECHAIAAPSIEAAIRTVNVANWVGLTATPFRADKMDGLITMQCGPVRHTMTDVARPERQLVVHETAFTTDEPGTDGPSIQAIYSELTVDKHRNDLIVEHVGNAIHAGRTCLVLTSRVDHLRALSAAIEEHGGAPIYALHGQLSAPERRAVRARLIEADRAGAPFVLVAIDKIAGEGLDIPSMNTLFLAVPVSFKGRVIQQIGRVTRGGAVSSTPAIVHDFRDSKVPMLERMHQRRRRVMTKEGFTVVA